MDHRRKQLANFRHDVAVSAEGHTRQGAILATVDRASAVIGILGVSLLALTKLDVYPQAGLMEITVKYPRAFTGFIYITIASFCTHEALRPHALAKKHEYAAARFTILEMRAEDLQQKLHDDQAYHFESKWEALQRKREQTLMLYPTPQWNVVHWFAKRVVNPSKGE